MEADEHFPPASSMSVQVEDERRGYGEEREVDGCECIYSCGKQTLFIDKL